MDRRDVLKLFPLAALSPAALAQISQPSWKPEFFTPHENESAVVISELVIPETDTPGAKAALVNRYMDKLLAAQPEVNKAQFRDGLKWLDAYTVRTAGKEFAAMPAADQAHLLETLESSRDSELARGRQFTMLMKRYTTGIYYATQAGFNELNKGGRVPAAFGCQHATH